MELKTKSKISSKFYNTITFHDFKPQSPRGRGFTRRGELKREGGWCNSNYFGSPNLIHWKHAFLFQFKKG